MITFLHFLHLFCCMATVQVGHCFLLYICLYYTYITYIYICVYLYILIYLKIRGKKGYFQIPYFNIQNGNDSVKIINFLVSVLIPGIQLCAEIIAGGEAELSEITCTVEQGFLPLAVFVQRRSQDPMSNFSCSGCVKNSSFSYSTASTYAHTEPLMSFPVNCLPSSTVDFCITKLSINILKGSSQRCFNSSY